MADREWVCTVCNVVRTRAADDRLRAQRTEPARLSELDALWSCLFRGIAGDTAYVCRFCDAMFDTAAEGRDLTQHGDRCPLLGSAQRRESASPDDEFWKNEVRVRQQEITKLRKVAEAAEASEALSRTGRPGNRARGRL